MDARPIIATLTEQLTSVPGIAAIVLGGSRARGTDAPDSDVDIGLYYQPDAPPDLERLRTVMAALDDRHRREAVTEMGAWGPWINGGGWFTVGGMAVDLLYRDLSAVASRIAQCQAGQVEVVYQPGHPHGLTSATYMAEIAVCKPLWDPQQAIARLKEQTIPYPAALRVALVQRFLWEARFSVSTARKAVVRRDVAYVAGCCFRTCMCLAQTLFALNECYWTNEKGAIAMTSALHRVPQHFSARVNAVFAHLVPEVVGLETAVNEMDRLVQETDDLVQG